MEEDKQAGEAKPQEAAKGTYSKRPWWQWALIYLVVGGIVYWFIYYLVTADGGSGGGLY